MLSSTAAFSAVERVLNFNKIGAPPWRIYSRLLRTGRINKLTLKVFDKSVWIWRRLDAVFPWKGLSLIVVARKTGSGEISSYDGLFQYAPGLTVVMSAFLFSLAGIPPLGGWFAKFYIFRAVLDSGTPWAVALGVIVAINSVIALFYYAGVARHMWMNPPPEGVDRTPIRTPASLAAALGICVITVLAIGVWPQWFAHLGDLAQLR